jgi:hypothetical protein
MTIFFSIHWFSISIGINRYTAHDVWSEYFHQYLGPLNQSKQKYRGFNNCSIALNNAKLLSGPLSHSHLGKDYVSFDFPGSACEALPPESIVDFYATFCNTKPYKTTRIDLAWDGVAIKPSDIHDAVIDKSVRSVVHRNSLSFFTQPLERDALGNIGTSSVRLGSNHSYRQLKVYDRRGFSRLEFKTRKDWADLIARALLIDNPDNWSEIAISHLRDFVDFESDNNLLPWWQDFIMSIPRARKRLANARINELSRKTSWIEIQAAPTISLLVDIYGRNYLEKLYDIGRMNRGNRFDSFLDYHEKI